MNPCKKSGTIFEKIDLKSSEKTPLVYLSTKFGNCKPQVPRKDMKNHEIKEQFALKKKIFKSF